METTVLLTALDKYGPLGVALIVVSYVLYLVAVKVIPAVAESHGRRLDALTKASTEVVHRIDAHEENATQRHGEILGRFRDIEGKIVLIPACRRMEGEQCPENNSSSA